jgi:poly(3-hydroxybutyrate) depolymerase
MVVEKRSCTGVQRASQTASATRSRLFEVPSSNRAHVQAGRAHDSGGFALANGSNQKMGLDNTFFRTTLAQTGPGFFVIGACP